MEVAFEKEGWGERGLARDPAQSTLSGRSFLCGTGLCFLLECV